VSAGATGSPVLLVHGFPETWWAFHKLIPLLAGCHRMFAVDLSSAILDFLKGVDAEPY
jgi:pimeloyl-ACP methyl ester carboxylesterase